MVAGNSTKRSRNGPYPVPPRSEWVEADMTQEALAEKAIGFNCLHYAAGWNEGTFNITWIRSKPFIDAQCLDGLRAEILFPSCWDGVRLDSTDHQDHLRYPSHLESGICPITHPVYLPILFYEVVWNTPEVRDFSGRFVLSNGDPSGYGYHGDFLAAWADGVLEAAAADPSCTDQNVLQPTSDGQIERCAASFTIQATEQAEACRLDLPPELKGERVDGILAALPGDVPMTGCQEDPTPH